jgi:DNA-binding NarL/FixJ family response regulator
VILADRHHGLTEGIRSLLASVFDAVVMVADEPSLIESAERIQPQFMVVDLALVRGEDLHWLGRVRQRFPHVKLIVISVHDEPRVRETVLRAGADAFLIKRLLSSELIPAIEAVRSSRSWPDRAPGEPSPTLPP